MNKIKKQKNNFLTNNTMQTLEEKWKSFKAGKGEEPKLQAKVKMFIQEDGEEPMFTAILSKEMVDRDGEVVIIEGIQYSDKGVPLLDSHRMNDNVVDNVLGRVVNITKSMEGDKPLMRGALKFAPTPKGQLAKMLVEGGFVDSVSIGFGVKNYDPSTKEILESELYETSLVSVPANPGALIDSQKSLKEQQEKLEEIEKKLSHYKTIKPAWGEILKTFLSETFTKEIGYEKQGDLLIDINGIYELVLDKFKSTQAETPQVEEKLSTTKTNEISLNDLVAVIKQAMDS